MREFFVVITLEKPHGSTVQKTTTWRTVQAKPEAKRSEIFQHVYDELCREYGLNGPNVIFYNCEPEAS